MSNLTEEIQKVQAKTLFSPVLKLNKLGLMTVVTVYLFKTVRQVRICECTAVVLHRPALEFAQPAMKFPCFFSFSLSCMHARTHSRCWLATV